MGEFPSLGRLWDTNQARGRSGVKHTFSFLMGNEEKPNVVCDIITSSRPLNETNVLSVFIKAYDVGATNTILCAVPSLSPEAKKLAEQYHFITIESPDKSKLHDAIAEVLRRLERHFPPSLK